MKLYNYGNDFFDFVNASSAKSANAFIRVFVNEIRPASVLDIGCGCGAWLSAWQKFGVQDCLGIDGPYVEQNKLMIPAEAFTPKDLATPLDLQREFDLVQCLEVAEHLPPDAAGILIDTLVRHGSIVLFSAAHPGQGGEWHINEQPGSYWMELFNQRGYLAFDYHRQCMCNMRDVEPWYRYNMMLFANQAGQKKISVAVLSTKIDNDAAHNYISFVWKFRCCILSTMPFCMINWLSKIKHYCMRKIFKTFGNN